ncbi:hypothetical protein EQO05_05570 [Methanosarcina sp. MSH10X1]|uniref:hypothetical protein n=1 Tax=Methanosarcina sp. MSH10X1 TaxID=2507075 RepID=UPI000FFB0B91|nr:hypothetical protein [Methanosarcina sp. MSH10X1]RXA20584.1 hypothetical protein EQO05_05570 [Methanosarcina sp. MSH10X1]
MKDTLIAFLGKYTTLSMSLALLIYVIDKLPSYLDSGVVLESFENDWKFFIFSGLLLVVYVMVYSALLEKYDSILRVFFKRPMLEYTLAKKKFKDGLYDIYRDPRKNHDILPQEIKIEIDKLDTGLRTEKIPKFLDLFIASFNSFLLLSYGLIFQNRIFLISGGLASLYFGYFFGSSFLDLKNTIIFDYKSLFEE